MKKYFLTPLLFICQLLYSQITVNKSFQVDPDPTITTSCADVFAYGYGQPGHTLTLTAGKLYLYFAFTAGATHHAGFVNIGSGSAVWTEIADFGNSTARIEIFICMPTTTLTGEVANIGSFGSTTTGESSGIWEISGVELGNDGLNAIVQVVTQSNTTSADPSITLGTITGTHNLVVAGFYNNVNPFGATIEGGWTSDFNSGCTIPDLGTVVMSRLNTTDNTPSTTAASSDWLGFAVEIRAAGRKVMVIR